MDANIGGSSGGHLAVLLDDTVYHFQYTPESVFVLNREDPEQFNTVYNQLENRSIETTPLHLEPESVRSIRTRLDSYFLVQQKYLRLLALRKQDADFLALLSKREPLPVEHSAYFLPAVHCPAEKSSSRRVQVFDSAYWTRLIGQDLPAPGQTDSSLPDPFVLPAPNVEPDHFPQSPASYSQILSEKIQLDLAHSLLSEPHCAGSEFIQTGIEIEPAARPALEAILNDLRKSARALLVSTRPDRGGALLLTMARMASIESSLKENRLILLDATPPEHWTEDRQTLQQLGEYASLVERSTNICLGILIASVKEEDRSRQLNLLENCAARRHELMRTDAALVRYYTGNQIPRGVGPVGVRAIERAGAVQDTIVFERLLGQARDAHSTLDTEVRKTYSFNLIAKNCSTELLREITKAFPSEEDARRALGGSLYPSANFIPAVASWQAARLQKARAPQIRFSKRLTLLDRVYAGSSLPRSLVYLRESNVVSSTLYAPRQEDTMFLFFTDDAFFLRPVFGALNIAYGFAQAGAGTVMIPWDGGRRFRSGMRGALFSLPELVFFNIRKGSYPAP